MFRIFLTVVVIVSGIFLSSCKEEISGSDNEVFTRKTGNVSFAGTWVLNGYEDTLCVMKRNENLEQDNYGFIIEEDGKFTERKNIGWCGTPPVVYSNYEGTWEAVSDSILKINVGYWGGNTEYKIHISSVSRDQLIFRYIPAQ